MTALARALPATSIDTDLLAKIATVCGFVLLAALCVSSYGVDLSAGFF